MSADKINGLHAILLVDDDIPTNFIHRKVIEVAQIDAHIQTANSAIEALEYLTSTGRFSENDSYPQPGIIFLDINMPGMNGWEFLEDYKQLDESQKARIVIVMLSSSIHPADRERAEKNKEVVAFLNKPLTPDALKKVVDEYFI